MRGLRKDSATHRGLRPGVLRTAGRALAAAAIVLAVGACSGRAAAAVPHAQWLQLQSGVFVSVTRPDAAPAVATRPWTVQSRVADMAFLGDTLYAAINGTGIATIAVDATGVPSFTYHGDPLIFAHRTITTLVPRQGSVAVHLYYNALLNDAAQNDLAIAGISLVSWLPGKGNFTFLIPPFQKRNPEWEAAGFVPESENSFDFEWKYSDTRETRFAYTRYHADTQVEDASDRDTFMTALGVPAIAGPSVPTALAALFTACRTSLAPKQGTALQFTLRSRESPVRRSYRSEAQSDAAVVVPVFEEGGSLAALLPSGAVLAMEPSGATRTVTLPRLGRGFHYTDIARVNGWLVVPWEESSFTDVGRAGILVTAEPR
ncbi:MAG TPA: hypothetical protein VHE79_12940 [Spirochaetia bacterium]